MSTKYIIPVTLLHQAAAVLQPPEKLVFVTGLKIWNGHVIVLTQLIEVENSASLDFHA